MQSHRGSLRSTASRFTGTCPQLVAPRPGRRRWFGTVVAALAAGLVLASPLPSQAYTQANRDEQKRYVIETVSMTYTAFLDRKADFQRAGCRKESYLYQGLPTPGCAKPSPYNAFDWTDDGCSGAEVIGAVSLTYRNLFNQPCQLHDFGYRNLGAGLQLDRTEDRRAWIDSRFLSEMRRLCNSRYARNPASLGDCHAKALLVYGAVRNLTNWNTHGGWYAPVDPPAPSAAPPAPALRLFPVMNTSESPPDGVYFRNSSHTTDIARITGLGIYSGERVQVHCYTTGDAVGSYGNRIWYQVDNLSRPTAAGRANSGFVNAHYVDDGMTANNAASGIPAC